MLFLANEERDLSLLFTGFCTGGVGGGGSYHFSSSHEGLICYEPFYFSSLEAPSHVIFPHL